MRRLAAIVIGTLLVTALIAPATVRAADPTVTGRLVAPGAELPGGTWGTGFDADDNLWAGHIGPRSITKLDSDSGRILATFDDEGGFEGSDDLAVGPDGGVLHGDPDR